MQTVQKIVVGQRVSSSLYSRGRGVVYAIHGEQSPDTVRRIGGVLNVGGEAEYDIVFECGVESKLLPECILRGVQWQIHPEVVSPEVVQCMREYCAQETALRVAEEKLKGEEFAAAVAALRADDRYKSLEQVGDKLGAKLVAINFRREFRLAFPGVKFSVKSDSNAVRVAWTDGPSLDEVKSITGKYRAGHFDGMQDLYVDVRHPWTTVFGAAKYIDESRRHSTAAMTEAVEKVCGEYGWPVIEVRTDRFDGHASINTEDEQQRRLVYDFLEKRNEFTAVGPELAIAQ